jgi:hypothetical protein
MYQQVAMGIFIVSAIVWTCAGFSAATQLREKAPDAYALVGSPRPIGLWFFVFPNKLDRFTLSAKFRRAGISDRQLLGTLEVMRVTRWLQLAAVGLLVLGPNIALLQQSAL